MKINKYSTVAHIEVSNELQDLVTNNPYSSVCVVLMVVLVMK